MKHLLSADPSLLAWLCTSLSAGGPRSGGAFLLSFTFSFTSSSSARDLQHRTWRLRCCLRLSYGLLEVGRRHVLDLVASSHRLNHLYLSWHLWSHDSFLTSSRNSSTSYGQGVSRVSAFHLEHFSCRTRDANSASFLTEITCSS